MFGRDFYGVGHGSALTPWSDFPKFDLVDFGLNFNKIFENAFPINPQESDVVKVIELFDLEKNDVEVHTDNNVVTVKGEYSSDVDATRVYERFHLPEGKEIATTKFVRNSAGNKLVIVFQDTEELVNQMETRQAE